MAPQPEPRTCGLAVLKQDNGELAEDVIVLELPDDDAIARPAPIEEDLDDEIDRGSSGSPSASRLVRSERIDDIPGRPHPTAAVPGTLPKVDR